MLTILICGLTALLPGCGEQASESSQNATGELSSEEDDGIFNTDDLFADESTDSTLSAEAGSGTASGGSNQTASGSGNTTTNKPTGQTSSVNVNTGTGLLTDGLPDIEIKDKTLTILSHAEFETPKLLQSKYGVTIDDIQVSTDTVITRLVTMVNSNNSPDLFWANYTPPADRQAICAGMGREDRLQLGALEGRQGQQRQLEGRR